MNKQQRIAAVTAKLTGEPQGGYAMPTPLTWSQRAMQRLFPKHYVEYSDEPRMSSYVHIRFDWVDRLRVLVSGYVLVETRTKTDVEVSYASSKSAVSVMPPGSFK